MSCSCPFRETEGEPLHCPKDSRKGIVFTRMTSSPSGKGIVMRQKARQETEWQASLR